VGRRAEEEDDMDLQDMIDSSITGSGADRVGDRIDLGKVVIDLDETLHVAESVNGMRLVGRGRATRIRWLGPRKGPVFSIADGNGCELSHLSVELVNPVDVLVQTSTRATASPCWPGASTWRSVAGC
jgi:hypothetical protein